MRGALTAGAAMVVLMAAVAPHVASAAPRARPRLGDCAAGELCLWRGADFRGQRTSYELAGVDIESCVPLPATAVSLANRTGRPVTTYQSAECAETGEFATHPTGSWTPRAAYQVRAIKIWER